VQQLLTESGLLALAGGVLGLALGYGGIHAILAAEGTNLPRIGLRGAHVTLDWRVALFTAIVTLVTALLFGLVPSVRFSRVDLHTDLKEVSARAGRASQNRVRSFLVVAEISLALLLLIGAALLIRTLVALRSMRTGFEAKNVVTTMVTLDPRFAKAVNTDQIEEKVLHRLRELPGVQDVALTGLLPLEGSTNSVPVTVIGERPNIDSKHGDGRWETVSAGYFDALQIPLLRGRLFTEADGRGAPPVAIINQAMARQFWPDGNLLQDRLIIAEGLGLGEPPRQIVGIVGDVREDALNRDPLPAVYVPSAQRKYSEVAAVDAFSISRMWVVLRTRTPSRSLNAAIVKELRAITGNLPVAPMRSMHELLVRSTAVESFHMVLMSIFGTCALLLASVGIYGVMAYIVEQRVREIGIRMALGAQPREVRNMVLIQGLRLALIGIGVGMAAAFGLTRFIRHLLFGVTTLDPMTFLTMPIFLFVLTLAAVWLPAHRAAALDPIATLREQ